MGFAIRRSQYVLVLQKWAPINRVDSRLSGNDEHEYQHTLSGGR